MQNMFNNEIITQQIYNKQGVVSDVIKDILNYFPHNKINSTNEVEVIFNTMKIMGCFEYITFKKGLEKVGIKKESEGVNIDTIEKLNNYFDTKQYFLDFFVAVTQEKFWNRNNGTERWQSQNLSNEVKNELIKVGFKDLNLFNKTIDFNKTFDAIALFGATYGAMKSRLEFVLNGEEKVEKAEERLKNYLKENGKILILATNTRKIDLEKIINTENIEFLESTYNNLQKGYNAEIAVAYRILKKEFLFNKNESDLNNIILDNFKEFVKWHEPVTEFKMAEYLKEEQEELIKNKIEVVDTRVYNDNSTEINKNPKKRATTEDNIVELLQRTEGNVNFALVSGQPNIVSQQQQCKNAIIKRYKVFKEQSRQLNIIEKDLKIFGKKEETTENTLKSHLQTFAGTVFALYPTLSIEYKNQNIKKIYEEFIKLDSKKENLKYK